MSVKIGISFDTKQAIKAAGNLQQAVGKLGAAVKTMFRNSSSKAIESDLDKVKAKTEEVKASIKKMTDAKAAKNSAIREQEKQLTQLNSALKEAQRNFDKLSKARGKRGSGVTQSDVAEASKDIEWTVSRIEEAEQKIADLKESVGRDDAGLAAAKAELEQLNSEYQSLQASAKAAAGGANALKTAVQGLAGVLRGLLSVIGAVARLLAGAFLAGLKLLAGLFVQTANGVMQLGKNLGQLMGKSAALEIQAVAKAVSMLQSGLTALGKGALKIIPGAIKGASRIGGMLKDYMLSFTHIFSKLGTMIKYRLVRKLMSELFTGIKEGIANLREYSAAADNAMKSMSASAGYLKNSLAAMVAPALNAIASAFYAIANAAAAAMQAISRFFALIGGRSSYIRATRYAQDYADTVNSAGGGGGGGGEHTDLLGFDKINRLSDEGGGGGGAGEALEEIEDFFETVELGAEMQNLWQLGANLAATINSALDGIDWNRLKGKAKRIADNLATWINGFLSDQDLPATLGETIGEAINTAAIFANGLYYGINWVQLGNNIGDSINGFFDTIDPYELALLIMGKLHTAVDILWGMVGEVGSLDWNSIGKKLADALEASIRLFFTADANGYSMADKIAGIISGVINGAISAAIQLLKVDGLEGIGEKIHKALVEGITGREEISYTRTGGVGNKNAYSFLGPNGETDLGKPNTVTTVVQGALTGIDSAELGRTLADIVMAAFKNIVGFLTITDAEMQPLADKISEFINGALEKIDIADGMTKIGELISNGLGTLTLAAEGINEELLGLKIGNFITGAIDNAGKWIRGTWGLASTLWTKVSSAVKLWWNAGGEKKFTDALSGLGETLGETINGISGTLDEFFNDDKKWQSYGSALKTGLLKAIQTIDAESVAGALTGMITAGVNLLYGALGDGELTESVVDKAPELVNGIIDNLFVNVDENGLTVAKKAGRVAANLAVTLAKIINKTFNSETAQKVGTGLRDTLADVAEQLNETGGAAEIGAAVGNVITFMFDAAINALSFTDEQQTTIANTLSKALSGLFETIGSSNALSLDSNGQTGISKAISGILGTIQLAWEGTDKTAFQGTLNTLIGGALDGIVAAAKDFTSLGSSVCTAAGEAIKTWWEGGGKESVTGTISSLFDNLGITVPAILLTFAGFTVLKGALKLMLLKAIAGGLGLGEGAAAGAALTGTLATGLGLTLTVVGTVTLLNAMEDLQDKDPQQLGEDLSPYFKPVVTIVETAANAIVSAFGHPENATSVAASLDTPEGQQALGEFVQEITRTVDSSQPLSIFDPVAKSLEIIEGWVGDQIVDLWDSITGKKAKKAEEAAAKAEEDAAETAARASSDEVSYPDDAAGVDFTQGDYKRRYQQWLDAYGPSVIEQMQRALSGEQVWQWDSEAKEAINITDQLLQQAQELGVTIDGLSDAALQMVDDDFAAAAKAAGTWSDEIDLSKFDEWGNPLSEVAEQVDTLSESVAGLESALGAGGGASAGVSKGISGTLESTMTSAVNGFAASINSETAKVNAWMSRLQGLPIIGQFLSGLTRLPSLPYMAQGGVIPANHEFLAVLGDQKQGTNIEAPLDTIVSAVMAAMNAQGLSAGAIGSAVKQGLSGLAFKVGEREFGQLAADAINMNRQAAGKLALNL